MNKTVLLGAFLLASSAHAQPTDPPTEPMGPVEPAQPPPTPYPPPPAPAPAPAPYPQPAPYPPPGTYPPQGTYPSPAPYGTYPTPYGQPVPIASTPAPPVHKSVCIEGRPLQCDSVFLLELGFRGGTNVTSTFDIGLLVNQGQDAFGFTVGYLGTSRPVRVDGVEARESTFRGAYKARYRHYLGGDGGALDVGVGGGKFGVVGEVAIGYRDIIALTAGVNSFETSTGGRDVAASAGVRLGTEGVGFLFYLIIAALGSGGH